MLMGEHLAMTSVVTTIRSQVMAKLRMRETSYKVSLAGK